MGCCAVRCLTSGECLFFSLKLFFCANGFSCTFSIHPRHTSNYNLLSLI